jgi:hypothetical protein
MYMLRFTSHVPSTKRQDENVEYCIQNKGDKPKEDYENLHLNLTYFDLYKKK